MADDFIYGEMVDEILEECPALKTVDPETLRIFLCGFIMGKNLQIGNLEREIAGLKLIAKVPTSPPQ